jgi:hypothetical protein
MEGLNNNSNVPSTFGQSSFWNGLEGLWKINKLTLGTVIGIVMHLLGAGSMAMGFLNRKADEKLANNPGLSANESFVLTLRDMAEKPFLTGMVDSPFKAWLDTIAEKALAYTSELFSEVEDAKAKKEVKTKPLNLGIQQ